MGSGSKKDRYQRLEKIGEGSCGVVFRCRDRESGKSVAVKKVCFSYDGAAGNSGAAFGAPPGVLREITVLKAMSDHPNVVTLRDAFMEGERAYLVFEYIECDLRRHLDDTGPLPPGRTKLFSWQLLQALAHCHARRVAHRDVKPSNVLVSPDTNWVKLCDFSLARWVLPHRPEQPQTSRVASLWYRSPELLLGGDPCGQALDMWSVGCVIGEMLVNQPLFGGCSEVETLLFHFRLLGTPTEATWPGVSSLPHWCPDFPRFPAPPRGLLPCIAGSASRKSSGHPRRSRQSMELRRAAMLLRELLRSCPERRLGAEVAFSQRYFFDLDTSLHTSTATRSGNAAGSHGRRLSGGLADAKVPAKPCLLDPGERCEDSYAQPSPMQDVETMWRTSARKEMPVAEPLRREEDMDRFRYKMTARAGNGSGAKRRRER